LLLFLSVPFSSSTGSGSHGRRSSVQGAGARERWLAGRSAQARGCGSARGRHQAERAQERKRAGARQQAGWRAQGGGRRSQARAGGCSRPTARGRGAQAGRRCAGAEAELARRSARGTRRVRACVEAGSCDRGWRRRSWSAGGGMWRAGGHRRRAECRARG
jgi:hypothetical protein